MTTTLATLPIGPLVDAHPARRPERVTLKGRFVTLAPLDARKHAVQLYAASHGPERESVWIYLFSGPFASLTDFTADVEAKAKAADPHYFAILDNVSGRAVGYASLMRIDPTNRVIEVGGIMYAPVLQRTAGATETQYLLARYAFDELGYRRYEWKTNAHNAPSRRAAERFGFAFEGIFRQHMIIKGRNRDTAWFAMLDSEWPARKAAFERWLEPANFDGAGRQKAKLSDLITKGKQ